MYSKELKEVQLKLEEKMHSGGIARWHNRQQSSINAGDGSSTDWNVKLSKHFIEPLADAITVFMKDKEGKKGNISGVVKYLGTIDAHEAAFITIRQMLNAIAVRDTTSLQKLSDDISSRIEDQVRFTKLTRQDKSTKAYLKKIEESLKKASTRSYKHKKNVWSNAELKVGKDKWFKWSKGSKLHLGASLIKLACMTINIDDNDLFYIDEIDIGKGGARKSSKILGVTPEYSDWVAQFVNNTEAFHPETAPCVIPPRDWESPSKGGFHTQRVASRSPLIKIKDKEIAQMMTEEQMPKVYRAVNALQKTSWKVNTDTLDVLQDIYGRGLELGIPSIEPLPEPHNPLQGNKDLEELRGQELRDAMKPKDYDKFITWKRDKKNWHEEERSRVSNVVELGRTRRIAEEYSEYKNIYFVYGLDFRGRVYARTSGLSPQGSDIQKGLLRFSTKRKLGKNNEGWFFIHGANLWGWDKDDLNARITNVQTDEFKTLIRAIAHNPIREKSWVGADKPWQFLAWAFEYAEYLDHVESGGKPKDFKTFIACAQDGSCSGIQHYSAMLRDEVGGKSVNLIDSDMPQDIYGDVAALVEKWVKEDAAIGCIEFPHAESWLAIGITRGLTKKSVMTLPYGSRLITCRDSVGEYIDEVQKKENAKAKAEEREAVQVHDFGDKRWEAEGYMAGLVWRAIGEVVVAAREGMKFIRQVAKASAKIDEPLIWTTPTGFIIKQASFKQTENLVNTLLFGRIQFKVYIPSEELCPKKMQSGAAPNFIHGNDAAHLILSICNGLDKGIKDFWVVHDDFGTHACGTTDLSKSLRLAMHDMYNEDVLRLFLYEQEDNCDESFDLDNQIPDMGTLDLKEILTSKYIFS